MLTQDDMDSPDKLCENGCGGLKSDCFCGEFSRGKWFGNTDHSTSPSCFFFGGLNASDFHRQQWDLVTAELVRLTEVRDGNGDVAVELMYRREYKNFIIAYRFTSDWAYAQFNQKLTQLGGSLGRGKFDPFNDNWLMETFVIQKEAV